MKICNTKQLVIRKEWEKLSSLISNMIVHAENVREYLDKLSELVKNFRKDTTHKINMYCYIAATTQLENPLKRKSIIAMKMGEGNIKISKNKLMNYLRPYGEHYKTFLKGVKADSQNEGLYFK